MLKRKLIQIAAVAAIMAAGISSGYSSQTVTAETGMQRMMDTVNTGLEEAGLVVTQKGKVNELELVLNISKELNKSITSFEAAIQFDADKVKDVTTKWNSGLTSSQCKSVYNTKTGVFKLYVVDKKDLINQGVIEIGSIIVESSQQTEVVSALTLNGIQIVDLSHKKHDLTVERKSHYFTCIPSVTLTPKPTVTPTPVPDVSTPTLPPVPSIPAITQKPQQTPVKVQSIMLSQSKASIEIGSKVTLKAQVLPSNADNKSVKWVTSDKSIATVSSSGVVKGIKKGTVVVTAVSQDQTTVFAKAVITVKEVPVKKISLSTSKVTLLPKETKTLKAAITPSNATNQKLTYKSSNPKVAEVSKNGKITAKKKGTAVITVASASNPKMTAACKVTVTELIVSQSKVELNIGKSKKLTVRAYGKNPKVIYRSVDSKTASVSGNGKITAKRKGKTTITVKANGVSQKVTVIVK